MNNELNAKIKQLEMEVSEGAPAWVVTFGDLMSLLLCFFVLLLSFSEMDRAIYKQVAGSLRNAFGVQRKVKTMEPAKGMKIIAKDFDQELIAIQQREEFIVTQEKKTIGEELKKAVETLSQGMKNLIQVEVGDKEISVRLMGETTFDSGKADIKQQMKPLLRKIGSVLQKTKGNITVTGHTDNVPLRSNWIYKSNLELSIARAASVAEFLLHKTYIKPSRISAMGYGEYRPREPNDTAEGRSKNRRVEIILKAQSPRKPRMEK
ncbi:MAG: OmpA family protein [Thermodesulfobacteriota bacterium]|nr:OmpA family protein [Thermodesulfobacteriota bacterium]